jgi:hypothetical protein
MNATGESDMRNYYDKVRSAQRSEAEPVLLRLARIIAEWKGIEEPYIRWRPLEQMSEKETAEVEKLRAEAEAARANRYKTCIEAGILEPYEARYLQFGGELDKVPISESVLPPIEEEA